MRNKEAASWDRGKGTWGGQGGCVGIQIHRSPCGIFINKAKYAQEILVKHGMTSCDGIGTPMATKHLDADLSGTPVDQYLKYTIHMGLWYPKDTGFELTAFSDSDHIGCLDLRKSTSGGIQFLGGDKLVSWSSKKQDCTSMSSAEAEYVPLSASEAEYVSLSACCAQVLWMRTQLTDYGFHFDKIPMYCDSKAAIAISCNPVQHSRTKHIDVRYHFIKEKVEKASAPQIDYAPIAHHPSEFSSPETGHVVSVFQKGDDPIDTINHMISFLTSVVSSRYPATNNQLRTSSNPRQQATINDERVTIQPIQGRQNHMLVGSSRPFTSGTGGTSRTQRVIVCYNCKGEGHMAKQCTKPKRKHDAEWFKDKVILVQAQANG
nr:uncharacterized mitochondrial protein AtMg00810-like [Tanacetum cinerariifolium]